MLSLSAVCQCRQRSTRGHISIETYIGKASQAWLDSEDAQAGVGRVPHHSLASGLSAVVASPNRPLSAPRIVDTMIDAQPLAHVPSETRRVRQAELVASLCLATDLATGQPLEHGLRRTLLAVWLGEELGLSPDDLSTTFYVALLGTVGCILDGAVFSRFVKDEIFVAERLFLQNPSKQLQMASFFFRHVGAGDPPHRRLSKFLSLARQQQAVCRDVALQVGGLLDLDPEVRQALGQCDEHWNGKGPVLGLKGEEIHLAARLFILSHDVEVFNRAGGTDAAMAVVQERAGKMYDPRVAERFGKIGPRLLNRLQSEPAWETVLDIEPEPIRRLSQVEFDAVAHKVANFVDMRSPFTVGHSPGVAALAEGTARELGLSSTEAVSLRQAGLLHDLGRAGVPVTSWNTAEPLSDEEWDRMRRHPSLTDLVLSRSNALGHLGTLAGMHHERLDGSGYRGMPAASLPVSARILAVADCYQTKLEPRPYRSALTAEEAAAELLDQARAGKLDREVVDALLAAHGHRVKPEKRPLPAGLSEREAEVLSLAVRGLSNRQIADTLFLSPRTVGHHMENIYGKIGVSTRVGATLFALQYGLVEHTSPAVPAS
jgi:HD-GYP domain-containing protein (c-di-GMP phosphodiesterase class II)